MIFKVLFAELLTKAILDAHLRTCLDSDEQINEMRQQVPPHELIECLREMVRLLSLLSLSDYVAFFPGLTNMKSIEHFQNDVAKVNAIIHLCA